MTSRWRGCCPACLPPADESRSRWWWSSTFGTASSPTSTSTGTRRRSWSSSGCSTPPGCRSREWIRRGRSWIPPGPRTSSSAERKPSRAAAPGSMASTSTDGITVTVPTMPDDALVAAFGRLRPPLSPNAAVPTRGLIREIVEAQASTVLVARDLRDQGRIVGMLTLIVVRIPTRVRAWIEDVVVDETARGRGVGEALSQEAVRRALDLGARTVELTSRPSREAANRLYQRLGFVRRDSHLYRYTP